MEYDPDIFDAVVVGDLESVKMYWTKDINVDFQETTGLSMIMLAARYNHKEIVNHLLTFNPNLELRNEEGETAIDIAEKLEDKEIYRQFKQIYELDEKG